MSFKIVRNDITKMDVEAIVNTANCKVAVGSGCDSAIYKAAGYDTLLSYRKEHIGEVEEGKAFITPGFQLPAKYIIHTVSPYYEEGKKNVEKKLRDCYRNSLNLAKENEIHQIAFPLISTGSFGYPKEEGMRIALDEINTFLLNNDMEIILVVFDQVSTKLGKNLTKKLVSYIDHNYVSEQEEIEYGSVREEVYGNRINTFSRFSMGSVPEPIATDDIVDSSFEELDFDEKYAKKLNERMKHMSDTFSQYLLYLIEQKGMKNADVYNQALVDKKVFSKIKNNKNYHPEKRTALCLCMGAHLNLDETRDLLARAGYALSPCDKTDIVFSFFIEQEYYDMIELDIHLEELGLPCILA